MDGAWVFAGWKLLGAASGFRRGAANKSSEPARGLKHRAQVAFVVIDFILVFVRISGWKIKSELWIFTYQSTFRVCANELEGYKIEIDTESVFSC